jgi:quercetin dioxygenase-like cupin family protein
MASFHNVWNELCSGEGENMLLCLRLNVLLAASLVAFSSGQLRAQGVATRAGVCKPVSQRTQEVGCWILIDDPVGRLVSSRVFWHLDAYPTRAAAQADKGPHSSVIESLGRIWLITIEDEKWRSAHGKRITEIGPIPISAGRDYSAQFMESIFTPGMTAPEHIHSGPEAWFTVAGQTCLETSDGRVQIGRAGGPPVIIPEGLSMHLTATGTEQRRSLVLILHDSSKPPTTAVHDWTPKALCKAAR